MRTTNVSVREAREARRMAELRQRGATALCAALLAIMVALFAVAGTLDYHDRTEGLGASMVPDPEWGSARW